MISTTPWPTYIKTWSYFRTIQFKDEPDLWWWTNQHILLRGVGPRPKEKDVAKVVLHAGSEKDFATMAALDVKRVRATSSWEDCHNKGMERVRPIQKPFFGIDAYFRRVVNFWPKPIVWLVPTSEKDLAAPALVLEANTKQIVAVVMGMMGAKDWERSRP